MAELTSLPDGMRAELAVDEDNRPVIALHLKVKDAHGIERDAVAVHPIRTMRLLGVALIQQCDIAECVIPVIP